VCRLPQHETRWPGYATISPASWLIQHDVDEGRKHLNVSEWNRPQEDAGEAAALARGLEAMFGRSGERETLSPDGEGEMDDTRIPGSVQTEHRTIHAALEAAMRTPGRVGAAARSLAEVLHPHFVREEEIALPPLGWLEALASGVMPAGVKAMLTMTDTLKRELPRMLEEHVRIRAAVAELREAARAEGVASAAQLAEDLALHAQTEEEVLYPAAVLVGDVIRARMPDTSP
jgi:hypothetical protein